LTAINDSLITVAPFLNLSFSQMVDVTDPAAVDSLLQNAQECLNSFRILFAPYPFSTLSTLFKTLSSTDNILFINTA